MKRAILVLKASSLLIRLCCRWKEVGRRRFVPLLVAAVEQGSHDHRRKQAENSRRSSRRSKEEVGSPQKIAMIATIVMVTI